MAGQTRLLKHGLDMVVACCVLPVALPFIFVIAAAIKIEDLVTAKGTAPVFYREPRFSSLHRFNLLKFRVLKADLARRLISEGLTEIKVWEHDPQAISRIGRLLVRFYLDELPQILHVASGRMSLVGPRPILPRDQRRLQALQPFRVKAGLAGTFQLAKGTGDILDLDLEYVKRSADLGQFAQLKYDISIIGKTIRKMFQGEGL